MSIIQKPTPMPTLPGEQGCPIRWFANGQRVVLEVWVDKNCLRFDLAPSDARDLCCSGIAEAIKANGGLRQTLEMVEK